MHPRLTFIDFETTGLDEYAEDIIDFGAVRLENGQITERFSQLANPGRPIPFAIAHLTGITDEAVAEAPSSRDALRMFLDFVGSDVCVAHNAEFEQKFLDAKTGRRFRNPILDTLALARILLPTLEHHDLDTLVGALQLGPREQHRAVVDAELDARLWLVLLQKVDELKLATLEWTTNLLEPVEWGLKDVFVDALLKRSQEALLQRPGEDTMLKDFSKIVGKRKPAPPEADKRWVPQPLDADAVGTIFGREGPFAKTLDSYEYRTEQIRMARAVSHAFNNAQHLMVEAGTGTGKSIAYLAPAAMWATANRCKVILSTYTKTLQEQLFFKDVPLLRKALDVPFKATMIKGRTNYLCVRKLMYMLNEADRELSPSDRIGLLPVLTWYEQTQTGDVAENTGFLVTEAVELWPRLTSTGLECLGGRCRYRRNCFLARARALAFDADLIIANHAVVFAELGTESAVLPEYRHIIFDEAHHLEDAATSNFGVEMSRWRVLREFNVLYRPGPRGGRGRLTNVLFNMKRGRELEPSELERNTEQQIVGCFDKVLACRDAAEEFVTSLSALFFGKDEDATRLRYGADAQKTEDWAGIVDAKRYFVKHLGALATTLEGIVESLKGMEERDFLYREESIYELTAHAAAAREIITDLEFLLTAEEENFVFWAERTDAQRGDYRLYAAPLDVGPKMKELLYDKKDTIVFCSATLSASGRFDFIQSRLGLNLLEPERIVSLNLGSSFDFRRQVMIAVPTFLPEPDYRSPKFAEEMAELLIDLHTATRGRGLVLFTSYSMLNQVYPRVRAELAARGILVLGQGFDGSPTKIMRIFQNDISSVLLGTQSFWEGIDAPGETLSCLTVVKLPFAVFTDPLVKARCELIESRGQDAFMTYSLPTAVLRFKQGFGRLIRTRTDTGVVVVCDKRVVTKRYGQQFLSALPTGYRSFATKESLVRSAARFLDRKP